MKDYLHAVWAPEVRTALNRFIAENGTDSPNYDPTVYTVFDFDNTVSIFDSEEQLIVYQLERMAFALAPEELEPVLFSGLHHPDDDLSRYGCGHGSARDWIADILTAYRKLYAQYGPFSCRGLSDSESLMVQQDPWWQEFSAKMRLLYDRILEHESDKVAYPWINFWMSSMTEQEVYDLASASHAWYGKQPTAFRTFASPASLPSRVGPVSCSVACGLSVSESLRELFEVFHRYGIAVWICSASMTDVIRAAIDSFGLHDSVTGLIAMTECMENGRYAPQYDYETGCGWLCGPNGSWIRDPRPQHTQTQREGKVTAINHVLYPRYGHGPAAGFMDSTGDFNFCTEYASLQLVVCFNRADRPITDGGALIAAAAIYQKEDLELDLPSANVRGETLYLLQGRDENGLRSLLPSSKTRKAGSSESILSAGTENTLLLDYLRENHLSCAQAFALFSEDTAANAPANVLGRCAYGFLTGYAGYHSRR